MTDQPVGQELLQREWTECSLASCILRRNRIWPALVAGKEVPTCQL